MVKIHLQCRRPRVISLGQEDTLKKGMAPLQYSCLENSMDRGAWWATVHGVAESDMTEQLTHSQFSYIHLLSLDPPSLSSHPIPSIQVITEHWIWPTFIIVFLASWQLMAWGEKTNFLSQLRKNGIFIGVFGLAQISGQVANFFQKTVGGECSEFLAP